MPSSSLQAVERAGLKVRALEEQLSVRQETLRAAQRDSRRLEAQLDSSETEQGQLQHRLREADASNAALAQRIAKLEDVQHGTAASAGLLQGQLVKSEGANVELAARLEQEANAS